MTWSIAASSIYFNIRAPDPIGGVLSGLMVFCYGVWMGIPPRLAAFMCARELYTPTWRKEASPKNMRKTMLMMYYRARRCSLAGLRWCMRRAARYQWTPMSLGHRRFFTPQVSQQINRIRYPCVGGPPKKNENPTPSTHPLQRNRCAKRPYNKLGQGSVFYSLIWLHH